MGKRPLSKPTRVLVTGAAGQVGVDVLDTFRGVAPLGADPSYEPDRVGVADDEFDVLGLTHHDLDLTDRDATTRAVVLTRPDVIVNLAAYTQVDRAETDAGACYAVNTGATETLSLAAHEVGAHLITISTDYVFDGAKGSAYVENDTTNPLNVYGASKRAGELLCASDDTIVRTSWVMGVRGKNVLHAIAQRAASGETVRFVNDQTGTVTLASDLARALVTLTRARPGGIWHIANSGTTTWFEIAAFAGSVLGRGDDFATAISTSDLEPAPLATRPIRSDLSTQKWVEAGWLALPEWCDGVTRLLRDRALRTEVST
jgi:dTDP-4-dehydrorhamnose reductase